VAIKDYISSHEVVLTENEKNDLDVIVTSLSDASVTAAAGANEYEQAKAEILVVLPHNLASDVKTKFAEFETTVGSMVNGEADQMVSQQDQRKVILQEIVDLISASVAPPGVTVGDNQIDAGDMEIIVMPNICKIMAFYSIPSTSCSSDTLKAIPEETNVNQTQTGVQRRVKILFIVLGVVVVSFVGLIVVFAMRAKAKEGEEEI
jgi:hypothetical protein